jgi:hypothetical protein
MGRLKHQDRKEGQVRVLCLPYGKEADWLALPEARREELLHQDEVLPQRGALIAVVGEPTVVRAQDGPVVRSSGLDATSDAPALWILDHRASRPGSRSSPVCRS